MTSKGQVVIPRALRDSLRWKAGMRLSIVAEPAGGVTLRPVELDPIDAAFGCLAVGDPLSDLESDHAEELRARE